MQDFVKTQRSKPLLERKEIRLLRDADGNWREYPDMVQKLGDEHNTPVPWFSLPRKLEHRDAYRAGHAPTAQGYPELPRYKLRDFVLYDLNHAGHLQLKNETRTHSEPESWAYLIRHYFGQYPSALARLRAIDRA